VNKYYSALPVVMKADTNYVLNANSLDPPVRGEFVFMHAPSNKAGYLLGIKNDDVVERGIYHISAVGGENKPISSIEFTKTDQPFFLEAKADKAGILRDDIQMSEPYNCNMKIFGHKTWMPGKKIYMYIPRTWMTHDQALRLGMSGYYLITKVSNMLERTGDRYEWSCKLECKWESWAGETMRPTHFGAGFVGGPKKRVRKPTPGSPPGPAPPPEKPWWERLF
jgi:hypothetical protein